MEMKLFRLAADNLTYYLKEIFVNNGLSSANVIDAYPSDMIDRNNTDSWPTLSVEVDNFSGVPVEIGSGEWPIASIFCDLFANSKVQRDSLSYVLYEALNEKIIPLYDFNEGFPASIGDYRGITRIGEMYCEGISVQLIAPPENTNIKGEKYHTLIDGILNLPNL